MEALTDHDRQLIQVLNLGNTFRVNELIPQISSPSVSVYKAGKLFSQSSKSYQLFKKLMLDSGVDLSTDMRLSIEMFQDHLDLTCTVNQRLLRDVYLELRRRSVRKDINLQTEYDYGVCNSRPEYLFPIGYIAEPLKLLKLGYLPVISKSDLDMHNKLLEALDAFVSGISPANLQLLYPGLASRFIALLGQYPVWRYRPLSYHYKRASKSVYSLPLLLRDPTRTYSLSKRPRTDMSQFLSPNYKSYLAKDLPLLSLPVTRYAKGMSRGLYYPESTRSAQYLGTFYYLEPESETYLTYETSYTSFNKYTAFQELGGDPEIAHQVLFLTLDDYISGVLPADLLMTSEEICHYLGRELVSVSDSKLYAGNVLELYAAEDVLDQFLCKLARRKNIQVLVFTNMPGSHQVVTEVLDVADRENSFKRLVHVVR